MHIDWTTLAAAITAFTAITTLVGAVCVWLTKAIVGNFIQKSNAELLALINGTYMRSAGSKLTGHEIEQGFARLETVKGHGR